MYNLSLVLVVLVFSSDIGTELVTIESTIETTRRGGSSRYRRCRCRTLLYLPCIFRLRTETIWEPSTLRILIFQFNRQTSMSDITKHVRKYQEILFFRRSRRTWNMAQTTKLTVNTRYMVLEAWHACACVSHMYNFIR